MAGYKNVAEGIFVNRPNRFIAEVVIGGKTEKCHVKNTGRCRELLIPGCMVYLEKADNPDRKTQYDLIGVVKVCTDSHGREFCRMINMDSQIPNEAAFDWILEGGLGVKPEYLKREVSFGNSRFDIYGEFVKNNEMKKTFIEVKGVTLETDGIARFPDAPTMRGLKHIYELIECKKQGYDAYILFIVQMDNIRGFEPNDGTQPEFRKALLQAKEAGVEIMAMECNVTINEISVSHKIDVLL